MRPFPAALRASREGLVQAGGDTHMPLDSGSECPLGPQPCVSRLCPQAQTTVTVVWGVSQNQQENTAMG